jgi:hypothetical protein
MIVDAGWVGWAEGGVRAGEEPRWFMMNHARRPNCRLRRIAGTGRGKEASKSVGAIVWETSRKVVVGEELVWSYGDPDSAWV